MCICMYMYVYVCLYTYKYVYIHRRWLQRQYISRNNSMRILLDHFYYIAQTLLSFFGNVLFVTVGLFLCPWFPLPPSTQIRRKSEYSPSFSPKEWNPSEASKWAIVDKFSGSTCKPTFDNLVWQCLESFCNLCVGQSSCPIG